MRKYPWGAVEAMLTQHSGEGSWAKPRRQASGPYQALPANEASRPLWPILSLARQSRFQGSTSHCRGPAPSTPADLPVLRRLLFETGYCELKESTEARFHEFRCGEVREGAGKGGFLHPGGHAQTSALRLPRTDSQSLLWNAQQVHAVHGPGPMPRWRQPGP